MLLHQRRRLFEAMIETVAEHGYTAATVTQLRTRAGVSKRTIYDHFPSKEAYFLATYDLVVSDCAERLSAAYERDGDWLERISRAFNALISAIYERPSAARLALIEALGAGRAAIERTERASRTFERMISTAMAEGPGGTAVDPVIARGLVGGIAFALRVELTRGSLERQSLAGKLLDWALAYRDAAHQRLPAGASGGPPDTSIDPISAAQDEHGRMLASVLRLAASYGSANLTIAQIVQDAECPDNAFFEFFDDCEQCFLEAIERGMDNVQECVTESLVDASDTQTAVNYGMRALMRRLAAEEALARSMFVEIFNLGRTGSEHSVRVVERFTSLLAALASRPGREDGVSARLTAGAVWEVIRNSVARDETQQLPELADWAAYLVLVPLTGAAGASREFERSLA